MLRRLGQLRLPNCDLAKWSRGRFRDMEPMGQFEEAIVVVVVVVTAVAGVDGQQEAGGKYDPQTSL